MKTVSKGVAVLLMIICGGFTGVAQDRLRRIEQPSLYQYPNTPVTVVVKLDDREMVDRKAIAGPDWLHKLSLDVTNTSRKNIKALRIDLILRDFQTSLPKKSSVLVSLELINSLQKTEILLPGDCTTLKPPAEWIDRWVGYLKDQGEPEIEKIIIDTAQFEFTDGTMWFRGTLMRLDPETGRYQKVPENVSRYDCCPQLGSQKIDLDYQESRRTDEHGNQFKYRAKVRDAQDAQLGRWAWDVFLVKQP